jgi:heptosyltransferase III
LAGRQATHRLAGRQAQSALEKILNDSVIFDNLNTHTVSMGLKLASKLGLSAKYKVSVNWTEQDRQLVDALLDEQKNKTYALLHIYPKFAYKMWHSAGWVELVAWLKTQNIQVILTGSGEPDEMRYIQQLHEKLPAQTLNFAGKLNFSHLAYLLSKAKYYVGPDTVTTHLAAAMGTPTVALFGPSNPVKWGPWPKNYAEMLSPWKMTAALQKVNNVVLLQGEQPISMAKCVPCHLEGCDRHINSHSQCLDELPASRVIAALEALCAS